VKLLVLLGLLIGCTPYVSAGYDTRANLRGPIKNMVTMPAATARGEHAPPVDNTRSFSFAFGAAFGPRVGLEVGGHLHDVNADSFSMPSVENLGVDPHSPRYLIASTSIDVRFRWLNAKYFLSELHAGPAFGYLVDRGTADFQLGQGFRIGATAGVRFGKVALFADLYETQLIFSDGDAAGQSGLTGVTIGLLVR
jgi:hypothetical protein